MRAIPIVLLGLLLGLASPPSRAQFLLENVHGATLDRHGHLQKFEAMLFADGKVLATGTRASIAADPALAPRLKGLRVVDGRGRYLLPGLIDAHGHVNNLGELRIQADLIGTGSLDEALSRVRDFAAAHPNDAWLLGRGWNEVLWQPSRKPSATDLDAIVADRPAWLERVDGHAGWANHAALKAAGIDRNTPDPTGGRIEHVDPGRQLPSEGVYRGGIQVPPSGEPVLFLADEHDAEFADEARMLYDACASPDKRLVITDGAEHGFRLLNNPDTRGLVDSFIAAHSTG